MVNDGDRKTEKDSGTKEGGSGAVRYSFFTEGWLSWKNLIGRDSLPVQAADFTRANH